MNATGITPAAVLMLVMAAACARDHERTDAGAADTGVADAAPLAPDEFVSAYLDAACRQAIRCADKIPSEVCHPASRRSWDTVLDGWREGRLGFDPEAARDCLVSLDRCESLVYTRSLRCEQVFFGLLPDGFACVLHLECAGSGSACVDEGDCLRICRSDLDRGENCGPTRPCREPYYCAAGVCSGTPVGEPCEYHWECARNICIAGACAPRRTEGESCAHLRDRGDRAPDGPAGGCESPLLCVAGADGTETCVHPLTVGEGGPCEWPIGHSCPADLVCAHNGERDEYLGRCVEGEPEGSSCNPERGMPCAVGLSCWDGLCRRAVAPGARCDSEVACLASCYCDGDICRPLPVVGEPCAPGGRCYREARCVGGVCTLAATGASCTSWLECEAGHCAGGLCVPPSDETAECTWDRECRPDLQCRWDGVDATRCLPVCSR